MLAYAFDEHPLFRLAFPKAASRSMFLQTLFATVLKDAIRFGRVDVACSHKIVGMLIWYPPGCYPMSKSRILRLLPHYARLVAVSPVGIMKLFRAQTTLNGFRPKQPHCHGYFLGGRQGERVGTVTPRLTIRFITSSSLSKRAAMRTLLRWASWRQAPAISRGKFRSSSKPTTMTCCGTRKIRTRH